MDRKDLIAVERLLNILSDEKLKLNVLESVLSLSMDKNSKEKLEKIKRKLLVECLEPSEYAKKILSYNKSDIHHNGMQINGVVKDIIYWGYLEYARRLVEFSLANDLLDPEDMRYKITTKLINKADSVKEEIQFSIAADDNLDYVILKEDVFLEEKEFSDVELNCNLPSGCYVKKIENNYSNDFAGTFSSYSDEFKSKLVGKKFNSKVGSFFKDRFFIKNDVRLCTEIYGLSTAFDGEHKYVRNISSRLAKALSINVCQKFDREIDFAYVLPFPHVDKNYFHCLSEMIYGLRYIELLDGDFPIIYESDRFAILSYVAEVMNIKKERLVKTKNCGRALIKKAFMPDAPQFYWNQSVFDFFAKIAPSGAASKSRKIYLSRAKSDRSFANESILERVLKKHGFEIVHAQELSFSEQVEVFSNASFIVAPHGAGLANIAFCRRGLKFVELFDRKFVDPAFYLRSLPLEVNYACVIYKDNKVDVQEVLSTIKKVGF